MRQEKQILLDEIEGQIRAQGSFVIMRYQGLNANQANDFRREVAKSGGTVEVMRKRVLLKAAHAAGIPLELDVLEGHIGLVFVGHDPLETAKAVFKFSKGTDKNIDVIGGRFDERLYNKADVTALAELPTKDEMRAQFLSVLEAPMAQTLAVMDALLASLVYCLQNRSEQENTESSN